MREPVQNVHYVAVDGHRTHFALTLRYLTESTRLDANRPCWVGCNLRGHSDGQWCNLGKSGLAQVWTSGRAPLNAPP